MILSICCFHVLQLTTLLLRGPSEWQSNFTVSLNGVATDHEERKRAIACVQDFVGNPLFTQRYCFSQTVNTILKTAIAFADAVQHSYEVDPWRAIGLDAGPLIADLEVYREKFLLRGKSTKDTLEHPQCCILSDR